MKAKCWTCGRQIDSHTVMEWTDRDGISHPLGGSDDETHIPWRRFYCQECDAVRQKELAEVKEQYIITKTKMAIERAISTLEKQNLNFDEYEEAIKTVSEFALKNTEKFDSSYEIIAAVILLNQRIRVKTQYNIGSYRVDFCLPDIKCLVEIDGEWHKLKRLHDSNRDVKIRQILGAEWEIVRIPTKYLDEKAELLYEAIKTVRAEKQKLRKEYGGIIPASFSERDTAKFKKIENIIKR